MENYIDADKLKAEIERRKDYISVTHFAEDLLSFIDSLPEKKPSEDLEEEMDRYFDTMQVFEHENIFEETFHKIARHFAEWQKEQMMKDAVEGTLGYGPHLQRPIVMLEQVPDIWDGGCKSVKVIVIKEDEKL